MENKSFSNDVKSFRDSVHGYIDIPRIIVEKIIDTELFQRLRYVEQTGMRPLFPAARHDRFIHSLGVFYLGSIAANSFKRNAFKTIFDDFESNPNCIYSKWFATKSEEEFGRENFEKTLETWWQKHYLLFTLACLLHDCAHAPHSHTYEEFYAIPGIKITEDPRIVETIKAMLKGNRKPQEEDLGNTEIKILDYSLLQVYHSKAFREDYLSFLKNDVLTDNIKADASEHEKLSALMVAKRFSKDIDEICRELLEKDSSTSQDDIEFIARAITGTHYNLDAQTNALEVSLLNCLISILKSDTVDVDGLDYIVRDAANSGMDNWSIDYHRILSSFAVTRATKLTAYSDKEIDLEGMWTAGTIFGKKAGRKAKLSKDSKVRGHYKITPTKILKSHAADWAGSHTKSLKRYIYHSGEYITYCASEATGILELKLKNEMEIEALECDSACYLRGRFVGTVTGNVLKFLPSEDSIIYYQLSFNKQSLSVLQSVVDARNHEYIWAYGHPKVLYCATFLQVHLIRIATRFLCCKLNKPDFNATHYEFNTCGECAHSKEAADCTITGRQDVDGRISSVLGLWSYLDEYPSEDEFSNEKTGLRFNKTTDADIISLLKNVYLENEARHEKEIGSVLLRKEFERYFRRSHRKPLWKSVFEYERYFADSDKDVRRDIVNKIAHQSKSYQHFSSHYLVPDVESEMANCLEKIGIKSPVIIHSRLKLKQINGNSTFITDGKKTSSYTEMIGEKRMTKSTDFFYLYTDGDVKIDDIDPTVLATVLNDKEYTNPNI